MANPAADLQEKLQELRVAYAAQLPEKIREIEEGWNTLLQAGWDEEVLQTLHRKVHSLTGSGATFGFSELSLVSSQLEAFLKGLVNQKTPASEEQCANILLQVGDLRRVSLKPDAKPESTDNFGPEPASVLKPVVSKLVFVVEDEPELAHELALQLGYFGYDVRIYGRLDEFRQAIRQSENAIVIMDIAFPGDDLGGVKAMKQVQQGRETPIPVLFLSSHDDIVARLEAVRAGGLAYFNKPVNLGDLIDKLDELTSSQPVQPFRVLIVDDSFSMAAYHSAVLAQAGMHVNVVNNPMEVMKPLREFGPDLILMDVYMPECNGLELSKLIRQLESFVSIPIVYFSVETDLDKQLTAISLGGDDFLTKPIRPEHLISSVASRIQRSRLLRGFMVRDSLTGLLNHTAIKDQLEREAARARRQKTPLSFAMIDLDLFKQVNDTYGHPAGDRVIKSLARLLKQRLRETDVVGRYGGEEFAVIMSGTDGKAAMKVLDGIRDAFSRLNHMSEGKEFTVTFSSGIAEFPRFGDAIKLNEAADKALYEAKHAGRNRLVLARELAQG